MLRILFAGLRTWRGHYAVNALANSFLLLLATVLLVAPRRIAPHALVAGACYIPFYLGIQLGLFNFTPLRLLIAVGIVRIALRREYPVRPVNPVDRMMGCYALWMLFSSVFHGEPGSAFVYRLGLVYDTLGMYLLVRCCSRNLDDVTYLLRTTLILLVPLALAMLFEKLAVENPFSALGGVGAQPLVREGRVRATGPFGHPILAGTVGAVCLPLVSGLWNVHRAQAMMGLAACVTIILCSASSGPILAAAAGACALYLWRHREHIRRVQWMGVGLYVLLDIVMKDPAYFLIARIDLAGGSTSWYRARLIQSAFQHLSEWWVAGTDYTRDWMWVVVSWSSQHTDITSHYIQLGVWGGLPLMFLFIAILLRAFRAVGQGVANGSALAEQSKYIVWSLGASLFAIAVTGLSVSYFDQSSAFVYLMLGALSTVSTLVGAQPTAEPAVAQPVPGAPTGSEAQDRRFI
jgi:hypothetical protein